ncbi:hypothetical protein KIY82_gp18 [Mycobacterium phage Centaur]|uniref:Uncharacterized protein n=2 Tax=Turbidovirus TaxID=2948936 RepID=A0A076YMD7_9CAUD|nr:hypothetical protein AVV38_gp15 [Mycobacterium phage Piro94]YP_010063704.1 hypothetical protein KIY82_gp18 [Mycobacterium phage Centaur]AMB18580.1 hypothetical protein NASIATALIE_90 [Mycobacterium phage NaSiaTalie]AOZ64032.1 hypothetical protein SEA_BAEHEXIC_88 [Mycobacterium phage Baehexic]ATN92262.1 hypothetical protein SEA_UPDAWG_90 [Mycobacterium phage Updawg]AYD86364.1 hypothetical protein SEA_FLARE16_89 [Mycobacterium phage Flare16]QDM57291.1 hypothetical protein SEA_WIDEWALE_90 [Myc
MLKCSCGYRGFTVEVEEHIEYLHGTGDYSHQLMERYA